MASISAPLWKKGRCAMFIIASPVSTASHSRPSINAIWKERHEGREAKRGVMRVWVDRRRDGRMGERMVGGWMGVDGRVDGGMVGGWWEGGGGWSKDGGKVDGRMNERM